MIISLPNSRWFYRLLNAALIALLAWFAAGLLWLIFAPAPVPPAAAPANNGAKGPHLNMEPLTALFAPPTDQSGGESPSSLPQKLRGVIAAHDDAPAAAIFEGGTPANSAVQVGEELSPGVRLLEVQGDHVIVSNQGRRERIELDSKPPAAGINDLAKNPQAAPAAPMPNDLIRPAGPPHSRGRPMPPQPAPSGTNSQPLSDPPPPVADMSHSDAVFGRSHRVHAVVARNDAMMTVHYRIES
ncbi:MAG: hypothetical protein JO218_04030 [Burkholderiales bacterium]|nr:hypothetical protein [Burkholderiales bacterium]